MDNTVRIWNPKTGEAHGTFLKGHKKYITGISWEPLHLNINCVHIASASHDGDIRIWNVKSMTCEKILSGHTDEVTQVIWGGEGLIFSASRDRTIRAWNSNTGKVMRVMEGHGHWVNTLALSTDYVLRTSCFDHKHQDFESKKDMMVYAKERFDKALLGGHERLVSGSDDFTIFLWEPYIAKKPLKRMTGHQ